MCLIFVRFPRYSAVTSLNSINQADFAMKLFLLQIETEIFDLQTFTFFFFFFFPWPFGPLPGHGHPCFLPTATPIPCCCVSVFLLEPSGGILLHFVSQPLLGPPAKVLPPEVLPSRIDFGILLSNYIHFRIIYLVHFKSTFRVMWQISAFTRYIKRK